MGFLNDVVGVGSLGLIPDITGEKAAADAAGIVNQGTKAGIAETRAAREQAQANLQPFLDAATGEGGALNLLQQGLEQAPTRPELQQFQFDPRQALQNPALQFQQELGQQQVDRVSGLNRNLGSGQRLIGAQQFGQGLASQSLGDEFSRQQILSETENNRLLQNFALRSGQFNERLNRLSGLVNVGSGAGSASGQIGTQAAGSISNLIQQGAGANAAAALQQSAGINNLVGQGIGAAGLALGGGFNQAPGGFQPRALN